MADIFEMFPIHWVPLAALPVDSKSTGCGFGSSIVYFIFEERVREREKENKFYTGKKENREETHRQVIEGRNAERRTYWWKATFGEEPSTARHEGDHHISIGGDDDDDDNAKKVWICCVCGGGGANKFMYYREVLQNEYFT